MAKNSQIKNVLIKTKMEGGKEALGNLKDIDSAIVSIDNSVKGLVSRSRSITSAFAGVNQISKGMDKSAASILSVGKALEKSFSGNVAQTKKIESYTINMEFLKSIMDDFNVTAQKTAGIMKNVNGSLDRSPLSTMSGDLTVLVGLMQELVEGIDDLNTGTRISNKRMKQVREYIADVGQAADLSAEEIQELTREFIRNEKASEANTQAITKQANGLRGLSGQGKGVTRGFSDMVFGSNPLVNAYAAIAVNVYAASEAFRVLNEAASFDRLQEELASFSAGVSGVNVRGLARDIEEASGYALTFKDSLNLSTQSTAFGFTAEKMKDLTLATRKASIALGRDFSDSMDRVLKGITKLEIEVLDEIGVVTRLDTAFGNYAKTVGKSVKELSEYERQLALTMEVEKQLTEKYSGVNAVATEWEKLGANMSNATQKGLSATQKLLEPAIAYLNRASEQYKMVERMREEEKKQRNDQQKTFNTSIDKGEASQAIVSYGGANERLKEIEAQLETNLALNKKTLENYKEQYSFVGKAAAQFLYYSGKYTAAPTDLLPDQALVMLDAQVEREKDLYAQKKLVLGIIQAQKAALGKLEPQTLLMDVAKAAEAGTSLKSFNVTLKEVGGNLTKIKDDGARDGSTLGIALSELKKIENGLASLTGYVSPIKKAKEEFAELKENLSLGAGVSNFDQLTNAIGVSKELEKTLSVRSSIADLENSQKDNPKLASLQTELQFLLEIQKARLPLGNLTSTADKEALDAKIEVLAATVKQAEAEDRVAEYARTTRATYHEQTLMMDYMQAKDSEKLEHQTKELELILAKTQAEDLNTQALREQLALLKKKIEIAKKSEEDTLAANALALSRAQAVSAGKMANQNERTQVGYARELLDYKREEVMAMKDLVAQKHALKLLDIEEAELKNRKAAAPARDAEAAFSQLQGLDGLSELQQGGLQIGETLSGAFADAAEAGKTGFSGMIEHLSGNAEAFTELSMGLANAAGSMFAKISDDKIAGLDREIDAEKKRDGKSAESLARIKKLEAKKIKEQAKTAKAQVIMSTSVAIMRAFQDMGIWGAVPAAIMAGFGAMQISQINSASNGQLAALNGDPGGGMNITGGERSNKVDVSASAQSGEASFFGGTSNKLPGRSGGGRANAGDAIVMGEVGAEVFVPDVPGTVVPAGRSNGNGPVLGNMSISINAIDSASFEDRIDQISARIYENVENELRARHNSSLQNIG